MSDFINRIIRNITNSDSKITSTTLKETESINEINNNINLKNNTRFNNSYNKSNIETVKLVPKVTLSTENKITPNVDIKIEKLADNLEEIKIPNDVKQAGISANSTEDYNERIWNFGTNQRALSELWKNKGSTNLKGIATLDNRYLVAVTSKFGDVGDKIDIKLEDGSIIPCVIADIKEPSDELYTEYGHKLQLPSGNMGIDIIEWEAFETKDKINLGDWHNKNVDSIINLSKNS